MILSSFTMGHSNSTQFANIQKKSSTIHRNISSEVSDAIKNAKLKHTQRFLTKDLLNGRAKIGLNYTLMSRPSIGDMYSKYDVYSIPVSLYPQIFGINKLPFSASINLEREITFIRQYNSQTDSIFNIPYEPITKLPTTSDKFLEKDSNGVLVLKPGDFIGFRAPINFTVGDSIADEISNRIGAEVGLSYILSGEFDIQVFRMSEKLVRVKMLAIQDNIKTGHIQMNLMGFNRLGKLVVDRLFDTDIFNAYYQKRDSDLFIADYVFNIESPVARQVYDNLIGNKMKLLSLDAYKTHLKHANPFRSKESKKELILKELDEVNAVAKVAFYNNEKSIDKVENLENLPIVKLIAAHHESNTEISGFKFNLLKIFGFDNSGQVTKSKISILEKFDLDSVGVYFLNSISKMFSYDWIWLYGEKDQITTNLLVKTKKVNNTDIPNELIGLHINRIKDDLALTQDEYTRLIERYNGVLPQEIKNKLKFPDINFNGKSSIKNVHIEQEVYFTKEIFNLPDNSFDENHIRNVMIKILSNTFLLRSMPYGLYGFEKDPYTKLPDARLQAFYAHSNQHLSAEDRLEKKKIAYAQEIDFIPKTLIKIFNHSTSAANKYENFEKLLNDVPLFKEIAGLLFLQITPEKDLHKYVVARLSFSARKWSGQNTDTYYPNFEKFNDKELVVFRSILAQNNYITDRSYNLRNFFKEDGSMFKISELITD